MRRILSVVLTFVVLTQSPPALLAQGGVKNRIEPPDVPPLLEVPAGHSPFFRGFAVGWQTWICMYRGYGYDWALLGGQSTVFQQSRTGPQQVAMHFQSSNPYDSYQPYAIRDTWQHSQDSSRTWAVSIGSSTDPQYVEPGAIRWRLFQVTGTEAGPAGGSLFTRATYVQRVRTSGGITPTSVCSSPNENGRTIMVPYSAEYYLYEATAGR